MEKKAELTYESVVNLKVNCLEMDKSLKMDGPFFLAYLHVQEDLG